MKKIYLFAFVSILTMVSCKKENLEEEIKESPQIVSQQESVIGELFFKYDNRSKFFDLEIVEVSNMKGVFYPSLRTIKNTPIFRDTTQIDLPARAANFDFKCSNGYTGSLRLIDLDRSNGRTAGGVSKIIIKDENDNLVFDAFFDPRYCTTPGHTVADENLKRFTFDGLVSDGGTLTLVHDGVLSFI